MNFAESPNPDSPRPTPLWLLFLVPPIYCFMLCFWLCFGTVLLLLISSTGLQSFFIATWIIGALTILPLTFWSTLRILGQLRRTG